MAFQPVANTAQLIVRHEGVNQLADASAEWSVYTAIAGSVGQTTPAVLSTALETWINAYYLDLLSEDWRVTDTTVKSLEVQGGPFTDNQLDLAGTLTGDPPPSNLAMYFRFQGTGGGEPLAGGVFWPVGNEANLDGNNWLASFRTTCSTAMQALRDDVLDGLFVGQTHRVVSRYKSTNSDIQDAREALRAAIAASRRASGVTNTVEGFSLRAQVASQRDRRGRT